MSAEFKLGEVVRVRTSVVKPEDLKNTTLYVEPVGQPEKGFLARVAAMRTTKDGEPEAVISDLAQELGLYPPRETVVSWKRLILGGDEEGLRLSGMIEEIGLRSGFK